MDAPIAVICERVDDLVLVFSQRYVFQQLKTKDRGSWSANKVCTKKGGVDALIRSYAAAGAAALHEVSTFELWLEGPMSEVRATVEFFADPTTADKEMRKMLVTLGLPQAQHDDFLGRLTIHANTTPRGAIDAVIHQSVGALWPSLSYAEAQVLIERLCQAAEAAQAHELPSITVLQQLRAGGDDSTAPASEQSPDSSAPVLSREALRSLTPPLPTEPNEVLLERLGRGQPSSALELKLRRAGAKATTVERAKQLRAEAEVHGQVALAAGRSAARSLEELGSRVLIVAEAAAAQVGLHMNDPLVAASPGEYVCNHFLSDPAKLANLDHDQILRAQGLLVFGLLCQLSDECRFGWRP